MLKFIRQIDLNIQQGIALAGYDPVAYFDHQVAKVKQGYQSAYQCITYYFSTEENRAKFRQTPETYLPQYGGWCAYAMGVTGEKVSVNPKTYKIINGKLYLFYNAFFNNTLKAWNKNEKILMKKADLNWHKAIN